MLNSNLYLCLLAAVAAPLSITSAQQFDPDDVIVVQIDGVTRADVIQLGQLGVDIDGVWGDRARAYIMQADYPRLLARGYQLTRLPKPGGTAGGRAGYHSFAELTAELQAAAANYPSLCELHNAGNSVQGRALWIMKISDNVGLEEDEPEFRYISSMHGDEVVGMEMSLNLIELLTSQYGSNSQITDLVDETEIWIMPLMNPDGYVAGSRYNANGVNLNRDFPDYIDDPINTTAGRAAETRHVMNWGFDHSPVLSGNLHGGALVVNYPFDHDPNPWVTYSATPDDALIIQQSLAYSSLNSPMYNGNWSQGITNGVAWYSISGGMQDWNYVWQGCNDVTIEIGDSKWPNSSSLPGYWNDNRASMLAYMEQCHRGVRGLVTDSVSGQPLAATVRVVGVDHDVYTDGDVGDYHRMLLPGTYSLRFSANGYQSWTVSGVVVGSADATRVDIVLDPLSAPGSEYCLGDPFHGTPCPCGNDNDGTTPGAGCANGVSASGARLVGGGTASVSADSLVLATNGVQPNGTGLYFQANNRFNGGDGLAFGDGLRCAAGNLVRLQVRTANAAGHSHTTLALAARGSVAAGSTKRYQCWYRNTVNPPCGPGVNDFNLSNGYEIVWAP